MFLPDTSITLRRVKLSYVHLVEPSVFKKEGQKPGDPKWSVTAHIDKQDKENIAALKRGIKPYVDEFKLTDDQTKFKDGDKIKNKEGNPVWPGLMFFEAKSKVQTLENGEFDYPAMMSVCIIKNKKLVPIKRERAGLICDGSIVSLVLRAGYYESMGGGLTYYLNQVVFHKQDTPLLSASLQLGKDDEDSDVPDDVVEEEADIAESILREE